MHKNKANTKTRNAQRRKSTNAQKMLDLLVSRFPAGVTTAEIATFLYGCSNKDTRERVGRTARTLRKWGFRAHGFGGVYNLCNEDPKKLEHVYLRALKSVHGWALSADDIADDIGDAGDIASAVVAKHELKQVLLRLANGL